MPDEGNIKTRSINIRVAELSNPLLESQAIEIQKKFKDIFADEISTSQCCTIKKHKIDTKDHPPICQKEHRVPIHLEDKVQAEIEKLKNLKILQLSVSYPYGTWPVCIKVSKMECDLLSIKSFVIPC